MRNKAIILVLMFASAVIVLPATSYAYSDKPANMTQGELNQRIRVHVGPQRGRRGRYWRNRDYRGNRRWDRGRSIGRYNNRSRLVRQTYYVNGRRYVRYVRVRY